jgi:hypothetical protein
MRGFFIVGPDKKRIMDIKKEVLIAQHLLYINE